MCHSLMTRDVAGAVVSTLLRGSEVREGSVLLVLVL